jgi:hypothetical protein
MGTITEQDVLDLFALAQLQAFGDAQDLGEPERAPVEESPALNEDGPF